MSPSKGNLISTCERVEEDYDFWPDAMLPAWFVTDGELVIRKTNSFADELISTFEFDDCFNRRFISLEDSSTDRESLLKCIVDPYYPGNQRYLRATEGILREHLAILDEFNKSGVTSEPSLLIARLQAVLPREGVKPYVYSLTTNSAKARMGIKTSPPQGIKLKRVATIENEQVEYVDLVMAYRVRIEWSGSLLRRLEFYGVQPAIHDATARHALWEKGKEEEEARVTQFLSHALNTPLANTERILNTIKLPGLDRAVREERILELESLVTDVSHLVGLLLFINTAPEKISVPLRLVPSDDNTPWKRFDAKDVETVIAGALQSVHNRRTGNQVDVDKIEALFESNNLPVPSRGMDGPGLTAYRDLARSILIVAGFDVPQIFAICPTIESGSLDAIEVSEKAKTVLLNLLVVELVVNAVRNADEVAPDLRIKLFLNANRERFEIHVFNNGAAMDWRTDTVADESKAHGEKRRQLGRLLNQKAARALRWELNAMRPPEPGTLFVIGIPLEN